MTGRKFQIWSAFVYIIKWKSLLWIKKQNLDPMWKVLLKEIHLQDPTSFPDHTCDKKWIVDVRHMKRALANSKNEKLGPRAWKSGPTTCEEGEAYHFPNQGVWWNAGTTPRRSCGTPNNPGRRFAVWQSCDQSTHRGLLPLHPVERRRKERDRTLEMTSQPWSEWSDLRRWKQQSRVCFSQGWQHTSAVTCCESACACGQFGVGFLTWGIFGHTPEPHIAFCTVFATTFSMLDQKWVIFVRRRPCVCDTFRFESAPFSGKRSNLATTTNEIPECQEQQGAKTVQSVFLEMVSPAEGRRRLHKNTAYAHFGVSAALSAWFSNSFSTRASCNPDLLLVQVCHHVLDLCSMSCAIQLAPPWTRNFWTLIALQSMFIVVADDLELDAQQHCHSEDHVLQILAFLRSRSTSDPVFLISFNPSRTFLEKFTTSSLWKSQLSWVTADSFVFFLGVNCSSFFGCFELTWVGGEGWGLEGFRFEGWGAQNFALFPVPPQNSFFSSLWGDNGKIRTKKSHKCRGECWKSCEKKSHDSWLCHLCAHHCLSFNTGRIGFKPCSVVVLGTCRNWLQICSWTCSSGFTVRIRYLESLEAAVDASGSICSMGLFRDSLGTSCKRNHFNSDQF